MIYFYSFIENVVIINDMTRPFVELFGGVIYLNLMLVQEFIMVMRKEDHVIHQICLGNDHVSRMIFQIYNRETRKLRKMGPGINEFPVIAEKGHFHSMSKLSMQGVRFIQSLGKSQRSFLLKTKRMVSNIVAIFVIFQVFAGAKVESLR